MNETAHCMHLEEKVDLWYLKFSLLWDIWVHPADANRSDMRLLDKLLVCLFAPDQARRNVGRSAGSKLFANLAGGNRREQTNLLFDFLESLSTIWGQSINFDTTASDEDPMYTLTEIYWKPILSYHQCQRVWIQIKPDTVCMPGSRTFCQRESNFYTLFLFNERRDDPN